MDSSCTPTQPQTSQQGSGGTKGWHWHSGLRGAALVGGCVHLLRALVPPSGKLPGPRPLLGGHSRPAPQRPARQEAGAGGAAGSLCLLVPTWLLGRKRWWPGGDRGPSGTLCVPAVSSRSSSGEGAPRISTPGGGQGAAEGGSGVRLPRAMFCMWSSLHPFEQSCLRITRGSSP